MIGTSWAIALLTAVPIAPEELSMFSRAGEMRSSSSTAAVGRKHWVPTHGLLDLAHRLLDPQDGRL